MPKALQLVRRQVILQMLYFYRKYGGQPKSCYLKVALVLLCLLAFLLPMFPLSLEAETTSEDLVENPSNMTTTLEGEKKAEQGTEDPHELGDSTDDMELSANEESTQEEALVSSTSSETEDYTEEPATTKTETEAAPEPDNSKEEPTTIETEDEIAPEPDNSKEEPATTETETEAATETIEHSTLDESDSLSPEIFTVRFFDASMNLIEEREVLSGDFIISPIAPELANAEFTHWQVLGEEPDMWLMEREVGGPAFNFQEGVYQDLNLLAQYELLYIVNFYGLEGEFLEQRELRKGEVLEPLNSAGVEWVAAIPESDFAVRSFIFNSEKVENLPKSESDPIQGSFVFGKAVSDVLPQGCYVLNLYARSKELLSVTFRFNNGYAPKTVTVEQGESIEPVSDPVLEGFIFRGWSTSPDVLQPFDFQGKITENLDLYAFWEPQLVRLKLVYMYENPDDFSYTASGITEEAYAPASTVVKVEKSPVTDLQAKHKLYYSRSWTTAKEDYVKSHPDNPQPLEIEDIKDGYFQFSFASIKQISANGETEILLYYRRARIRLNFQYKTSGIGTSEDYPKGSQAKLEEEFFTVEKKRNHRISYHEYKQSGSGLKFTYAFTAKYGSNIKDLFPYTYVVNHNSNISSTHTFIGWHDAQKQLFDSNEERLTTELLGGPAALRIYNGTLYAENFFTAAGGSRENLFNCYSIVLMETLEHEVADLHYEGKHYTVAQTKSHKGNNFLEPVAATHILTLFQDFRVSKSVGDLLDHSSYEGLEMARKKENGDPLEFKELYREVFGITPLLVYDYQIILYQRKPLLLTIYPNDDGSESVYAKECLAGSKIFREGSLLYERQKALAKDGYQFRGWYKTSNFLDGSRYRPQEDSVLEDNLTLYAKWEAGSYTVEFYRDNKAHFNEPYEEQSLQLTEYIKNPHSDSSAEWESGFQGWFIVDEAGNYTERRLNFNVPLTPYYAEYYGVKDGVIRFYGRWNPIKFEAGKDLKISLDNRYNPRPDLIHGDKFQLPKLQDIWDINTSEENVNFIGWHRKDSTDILKPGDWDGYNPNEDVVYIAAFVDKKDTVTITYSDGLDPENTYEASYPKFDNEEMSIPVLSNEVTQFKHAGYKLVGWSAPGENTITHHWSDTSKLTKLSGKGDITLEAVWQRYITARFEAEVSGNFGDLAKNFHFRLQSSASLPPGESYVLSTDTDNLASFNLGNAQTLEITGFSKGDSFTLYLDGAENYEHSISINGQQMEYSEDLQAYYYEFNSDEDVQVLIKLSRNINPDTGLLLERQPYLLLLGTCLAILILSVMQKVRSIRKEDADV